MSAKWGVSPQRPHSGLHAARGIVLALLPAIAFWVVVGIVAWAVM